MKRPLTVVWSALCAGTWAQAELPPPPPRVLFDADGRAALRKRVQAEPYAAMCERIVRLAGSQTFDPAEHSSVLYDTRIRQYAQAYALTGGRTYAREAERAALKFVADRQFWYDPRSKGLPRAAGALSVAIACDFCQDAWRLRTRARVSRELLEVARGLMRSMGRGANTKIANKWQGVRYGAAGLAAPNNRGQHTVFRLDSLAMSLKSGSSGSGMPAGRSSRKSVSCPQFLMSPIPPGRA